jgi:hypothetical protein
VTSDNTTWSPDAFTPHVYQKDHLAVSGDGVDEGGIPVVDVAAEVLQEHHRRASRGVAEARPFQDHDVRPRMVNGLSMERPAHRVASVMSGRPASRRAPIARLRKAAMILGPFRVLTWDLSSW